MRRGLACDQASRPDQFMKQATDPPLDGPHQGFFTDGKLSAEGCFKEGKRHGKWKYYYRNGTRKAVG